MTVYVYFYIINKINIPMLQRRADMSHLIISVPKKLSKSSAEQLNLLGTLFRQ